MSGTTICPWCDMGICRHCKVKLFKAKMSMFEESVEIHPAFVWDCPECGRELFGRMIVHELSDEKLAELKEDHGVEPWEEGNFVMAPKSVICPHCNLKFTTI